MKLTNQETDPNELDFNTDAETLGDLQSEDLFATPYYEYDFLAAMDAHVEALEQEN